MLDKVKQFLGLSNRKTGNQLIISCEKLERRVALSKTVFSKNTTSNETPTEISLAVSSKEKSKTSSTD